MIRYSRNRINLLVIQGNKILANYLKFYNCSLLSFKDVNDLTISFQILYGIKLKTKLMDGQLFEGWHEGTIEFAPTYKYCLNSTEYYGVLRGKKGEKKRSPAWYRYYFSLVNNFCLFKLFVCACTHTNIHAHTHASFLP